MTQSIIKQEKKQTFGTKINAPAVKNLINETLGSEIRGKKFVASLTSAVSTNPQLAQCEFSSIVNGALQGEVLGLNQQLGQYSLVPYNCKVKDYNGNYDWVKKAQFQVGYKGIIQLAERTGEYKRINVKPIKEGELVKCDLIRDIYEFEPIQNVEERLKAKTIGYYAYFKYHNGFMQETYWSVEEVREHAKKFSKTYNEKSGVWCDNFDKMARKTVIKSLLSTWGIMSIEMQRAVESDQAVIKDIKEDKVDLDYVDNEQIDYVDNDEFSDVKAFMEQEKVNQETGEVQEQEEMDFNSLG